MHTQASSMIALALAVAQPNAIGSNEASSDQTVAELRAVVAELQQQVDQLRFQNDDNWLTQQRADEIRGLVHDVLTDADTRASLLQNGLQAGYDKNFFLGSADGNFLLKIAGQMQFRFVYNNQDDSAGDAHRWGFENRRTKVRFYGHVVDPSWEYLVLGAFERDGGAFVLDEGFIAKKFENGMKLRMGQIKPPFLREELVSSARQLAVERSLVNEEFNQDRAQGLELSSEGEQFRWAAMYSDGFFPGGVGTDNTGWSTEDTEYALTGRAEFLVNGDWKSFDDFTSWRGEEGGVLIGAAAHYQDSEFGTASEEVKFLGLTADVSLEFGGANVYAAIVYRNVDSDTGLDVDQLGAVIQGGWFLTDEWELFGRYEWADADTAGIEDLSVVTVGANRYFAKHALKWTTDIGFGLNEVAGIWSTSSAGWRTDPAGGANEDGQFVIRTQFQLLF